MSVIEPWGLDAGTDEKPAYTGLDFRAMMSGLLVPGDRPLSGRSGVLVGMETSVSGNTLTVKPGVCIVNTMAAGSYWSGVKETMTLSVPAAHATYERRDLLVCQVEDLAPSGRGAEIKIISGTPSASPSIPGTPNNACAIATLTVPSQGDASVSAATIVAGISGGLRGANTSGQADALATGATKTHPALVWREDQNQLLVHNGSEFHQVAPQRKNIQHTYKSGFAVHASGPLTVFRIGDRYFMEGCVKRSEGSSKINDHIVGSLPNIADRPAFNTRCAGIGQYTYRLMLFVSASGDFGFTHNESSSLSANNWISFTGLTWSAKL